MIEWLKNKYIERQYIEAVNHAASICNMKAFHDIKNINTDKEVVVCGAGPSLKKYQPLEKALHVALNRALLNEKIKFDWFIADDWDGIYFFKDQLQEYECKKFLGYQPNGAIERIIPESFRIDCEAKKYYTDSYIMSNGFNSKFVCDIDMMAIGNMPNIALSAMQIILFTNPKRIYLVGCDASQGHFVQPDLIDKKTYKRHEKDLAAAVSNDKVIKKWIELKKFAGALYPNTEIVSINPVGLRGIFRDVYQNKE